MKAQKNLRVASSASTFVPSAAWKTPSSCCSTQPFLKIQIWQSLSRENIQTLFLNFQEECFFFFFFQLLENHFLFMDNLEHSGREREDQIFWGKTKPWHRKVPGHRLHMRKKRLCIQYITRLHRQSQKIFKLLPQIRP